MEKLGDMSCKASQKLIRLLGTIRRGALRTSGHGMSGH